MSTKLSGATLQRYVTQARQAVLAKSCVARAADVRQATSTSSDGGVVLVNTYTTRGESVHWHRLTLDVFSSKAGNT